MKRPTYSTILTTLRGGTTVPSWAWAMLGTFGGSLAVFILLHYSILQQLYEWVWGHTTDEPWTAVFIRHPLVLIIPEAAFVGLLIAVLPERKWAKIVLVDVVFFLGMLTGHAFWPYF